MLINHFDTWNRCFRCREMHSYLPVNVGLYCTSCLDILSQSPSWDDPFVVRVPDLTWVQDGHTGPIWIPPATSDVTWVIDDNAGPTVPVPVSSTVLHPVSEPKGRLFYNEYIKNDLP